MTDDNSNLVDMDLNTFEAEFFQNEAPKVETETTDDDAVATDEDKDAVQPSEEDVADEPDEDEAEEASDDAGEEEEEDEESESEDKPDESQKKSRNRKSFQKRIDEVTRRAYEAERANQALLQRLEALETRERDTSTQQDFKETLPQGAPDPDAEDKDGNPIYPLGRFDPLFITDLTKFSVEEQMRTASERMQAEAEQRKLDAAKAELTATWAEKLDEAEEEIPELREHMEDLVGTFQNLDPSYGEYLALTIMQSENGPAIMEYLSQNIGEAQTIVASGPAAATLSIGRLDARLSKPREKGNSPKVSNAPPPPDKQTKGRKGHASVRPDTDDLNAFENEFFK